MKTYLYLSTAVAGMMIGGNVWAQCVNTQDCTALGYTESNCPDGNGVKCPFGDKWFCGMTKDECAAAVCEDFGFIYKCDGQNEVGVGKACGNLYTECECLDGYERTEGLCAKPCASYINERYVGTDRSGSCLYHNGNGQAVFDRCICEVYEVNLLESKEFVNGEWKCEYRSYTSEMKSNCVRY